MGSRIGKLPIKIPKDVSISHNIESNFCEIIVKGKFGTLQTSIPKLIKIEQEEDILKVNLEGNTKNGKSLIGVSEQFELTLILKGVGYRAILQGQQIILNLGYSHSVNIEIPKPITVNIVQNNIINLKSCDKELLGLFASNIRSWRCPEPYKGKGILYKDEQIIRKAGKSGK